MGAREPGKPDPDELEGDWSKGWRPAGWDAADELLKFGPAGAGKIRADIDAAPELEPISEGPKKGQIVLGAVPPPDDAGDGPPVETCPVTPLGHGGGVYFYLSKHRELRAVSAAKHTARVLESLYDGDVAWLEAHFRRTDRRGHLAGYDLDRACQWQFRECAKRGFLDPWRQVRGPGAWRGEGGLVIHAGDRLILVKDGARVVMPSGQRRGEHIYVAAPAETMPADAPATTEDARDLYDLLESWRWRAPRDAPLLLLGWVAAAFVCGALWWRSHVWITGETGSGKTWLLRLVGEVLGSLMRKSPGSTEAGVRQTLAGAARPLLLDEMEAAAHGAKAAAIIDLARIASSDEGGDVWRGSPEGEASRWPIRATFLFGSILHPAFLPQDASRTCVLELDELEVVAERGAGIAARIARMAALGPRLYSRVVLGWPRFQANLLTYQATIARLGRSARAGDQIGVLLAGAETMLSDAAVDAATALARCQELDFEAVIQRAPERDCELALTHLMTAPIGDWRGGRRRTVGEIIEKALCEDGAGERQDLQAVGLKLLTADNTEWLKVKRGEPPTWLAVANQHTGLEEIFAATRWGSAVWGQALRRLPGAKAAGRTMRFAGSPCVRHVLLPASGAQSVIEATKTDPPEDEQSHE